MLTSKKRTPEEIQTYMRELKGWLEEARSMPVEEMNEFFAKRIEQYDHVHMDHWPEEYAHIADYFEDGLSVLLDIGCGTGLEFASIYERFPQVELTGIDLSETMLGELRRKYENQNPRLICADYFKCPFEEYRYDAAMSFETLHHFKPGKKQQIYDKLVHAIRDGGYYIECDYIACCGEEETLCLQEYEYRRRRDQVPDDVFVHIDIPLTFEHQTELLHRAGFKTVDVLYENQGTMILKAVK